MKKIKLDQYNKKRKKARLTLLKIRDELGLQTGKAKRRSPEKRKILYKKAKQKKEKMLEKVEDRKYKLKK